MKHYLLSAGLLVLLFLPSHLFSQDFTGYNTDNYSGIHGARLNPASIADSRYKEDIVIGDWNFYFLQNFTGIHRDLFFNYDPADSNLAWSDFEKNVPKGQDFNSKYFSLANNHDKRFVYLNNEIGGPSLLWSYNEDISFGFSTRFRTIVMADNISDTLARFVWDELLDQSYWQMPIHEKDFGIFANSWVEYGLSYAQKAWESDDKKHYIKAGGTLKLLQGLGAAYIYSQNLQYNWKNKDTLSIVNSDLAFGHSDNFDIPTGNDNTSVGDHFKYRFAAKPSIGADLGVIYEWRPDIAQYKYDMDGEKDLSRRDLNKYKLRAGISLLDIGRIKYKKGTQTEFPSGNFHADVTNWRVKHYKLNGIPTLDSTVAGAPTIFHFNNTADFSFKPDDPGYFKMPLPTALSVQVDYDVWKEFYLGFVGYQAFKFKKRESKVRALSLYTLTPRYERRGFGVGLPISYTSAKQLDLGLSFRAGPVVIGTSDWTPLLFKGNIYGLDFYFGLRLPLFQTRVRDKDNDGISDKMDNCIDVPGPFENKGCPYQDLDKDGVLDNVDNCIDVPGPVANHGCPYGDLDGDGVLDDVDKCIDVVGPVENNGCPYGDLDGDGTLDNLDKCIDVAGPAENNGCPYGDLDKDGTLDPIDNCIDVAGPAENHGCPYGDLDKDGVLDNIDKCIDLAGPAENSGCPYADSDKDGVLDKDDQCPLTPGLKELNGCPKLEKKEEEILKYAFDNLEFETDKAIIRSSSYASLDSLASLLIKKPTYGLKIAGHTDNVGSDEHNMILSKDRAEAVKTYLVARGVKADKLVVEYYGETRPIADNSTEDGRQKNRRVEMNVIFQ